MIKIKFNENNTSIIFLYLNSLDEYMKIIRSIVIIRLRIDGNIIFINSILIWEGLYNEKKKRSIMGLTP